MKARSIFAALICLTLAGWGRGSVGTVTVIGDYSAYAVGNYTAFLAPFNQGSYVNGVQFSENASVAASVFPAYTRMTWFWPTPACPSICGFLQISYGDYLNGNPNLITPRQISGITTLTSTHDLTLSGTTSGYNVIYDLWLTNAPHSTSTLLFEVEVFLHATASAISYFGGATTIGTTTISGVQWGVAIDNTASPPNILFLPTNHADVPTVALDIKAMFAYLVAQGIIANTAYYNGHALGVEPRQADGSLFFKSFSVTYN